MFKKISLMLSMFIAMAVNSSLMAQNIDVSSLSQQEISALIESQQGSKTAVNKLGNIDNKGQIPYARKDGQPDLLFAGLDSLTMDSLFRLKLEEVVIPVFGQNIFRKENLTFAPSYSIPTPRNYIVGAGDIMIIELWGSMEAQHSLEVSPDGNINVPQVGVVNVSGLTIEQVNSKLRSILLNKFYDEDYEGEIQIQVGLGDIRSIRVNVIGEAFYPGSYTLPSLATIFNALYAAGGVSEIGSLRNIKLYRGNELVSTLDVYDYLIGGKTEVDQRLEDGDMIVVSPYENIVTLTGEVKRPMKYEMIKGESGETIIEYAGGFTGNAYTNNLTLTRQAGGRDRSIHTISSDNRPEFLLMDGDSISVGRVLDDFSNRLTIEGAVYRPGDYELSDNISTLKQLVVASEGVTPYAYMGRGQIVRTNDDKTLKVIPFNVTKVISGGSADIKLQKDDRVIIPNIQELKEEEFINIKGEVNNPQIIPYASDMTIEDVIIMSSGLKNSASLARIEVSRRIKDANATQAGDTRAEFFTFSIPENLELTDATASFTLMPYDEVFVRRSPSYRPQASVFLNGEINFPGEYTMESTYFTLADLVEAGGGITKQAYVKGAVLHRKYTVSDSIRLAVVQKLAEVANSEQKTVSQDGDIAAFESSELAKVGDIYTIGIDLVAALSDHDNVANLTLREGDMLDIPIIDNTVRILGAVYYPTSTTYNSNLSVREYIKMAGDYSELAKRRPFVIFMNGDIKTLAPSSRKLEPGCQIVVPYKAYRAPMTTQGWVSIATSVVSMAAMITSLFT